MTPNEERAYLLNLLFESARWRVDADDPMCAIELEIRDRIQRLNDAEEDSNVPKTIIKPGQFVDTVEEPLNEDDFKELEAARLNEHLERATEKRKKQSVEAKASWKQRNVRVKVNGKTVWKPREQCRQVPRDNSRGGLPWMWQWVGENLTTVAENSATKDKQCEAMWAEHELSK